MTQKQYGVVLIGCGYIGEEHLRSIYFKENVKVIATVDINIDLAKEFSRKYNAKGYDTDYKKYLTNEETDIFIIATNTKWHSKILLDCIKHEKNVLCEKPLAASLEEVNSCYEAIKTARSKILVGHILRHSPTYKLAKQMIDNNAIGEPKIFRMIQNHQCVNWNRYLNLLDDCSPIIDCGVHYIDVAQWFSGSKVVEVSGLSAKIEPDCKNDNFNMLNMKLENGTLAFFECCWSKNAIGANVKEFIGDKGYLKITLGNDRPFAKNKGDLLEYFNAENNTYEQFNIGISGKNMVGQFEHLVKMIEENIPANPLIEEVVKVMNIAIKADEAVKTNRIICL